MRFTLACSLFVFFILASKRPHGGSDGEEKFMLSINRSKAVMRQMVNITSNFLQATRAGDRATVAMMIDSASSIIKRQAFKDLVNGSNYDIEMIRIFLTALGPNLRNTDSDSLDKLIGRAISYQNIPLVKLVLPYISATQSTAHFFNACRDASVEIVKLLIENGVNPAAVESHGLTTALNNANFSVALLLIQYSEVDAQLLFNSNSPAAIGFKNTYGPILKAAINGDSAEFEAAMIADINTQQYPYPYPLAVYEAILGIIKSYHHVELAKFFIRYIIKNESNLNAVLRAIIDNGVEKFPKLLALIKGLEKALWSFLRLFQARLDADSLGNIQAFLIDLTVEEFFNN